MRQRGAGVQHFKISSTGFDFGSSKFLGKFSLATWPLRDKHFNFLSLKTQRGRIGLEKVSGTAPQACHTCRQGFVGIWGAGKYNEVQTNPCIQKEDWVWVWWWPQQVRERVCSCSQCVHTLSQSFAPDLANFAWILWEFQIVALKICEKHVLTKTVLKSIVPLVSVFLTGCDAAGTL